MTEKERQKMSQKNHRALMRAMSHTDDMVCVNNISIKIKENELYREIELLHDGIKIGEAEINLENHMLAKLVIFEPYQNQGFGTEAVKILTEVYNLDNLWVRADNNRAIHVYEKCGFSINQPTMFEMVRTLKEE